MVYGVMVRHEGTVEIESQLGRGTTFRLIFPVQKPATTTRPQSEEDRGHVSALRVLCVDDEPLVREVMREILESEGHEVHLADGGQAGVDAFRLAHGRQESFDVVITDLGMPYFDGRQVAQTIKRESPHTPVLMLTGWGALLKADEEMPAQVDGILSKPPRVNLVREALANFSRKPLNHIRSAH